MFREIREEDRAIYYDFVDKFYHTDAVNAPVPTKNYDFEMDGSPCGFALLSKTFSQEAGGLSVTIEEIYIEPEFRGKGLGTSFFEFLKREIPAMRFRIEVEDDNDGAKRLYERMGFELLPYLQMVIDKQRQG